MLIYKPLAKCYMQKTIRVTFTAFIMLMLSLQGCLSPSDSSDDDSGNQDYSEQPHRQLHHGSRLRTHVHPAAACVRHRRGQDAQLAAANAAARRVGGA